MSKIEFYEFFNENASIYFIAFLIIGVVFFGVISRTKQHLISPLNIALISMAFADTIPLFLAFSALISIWDFIYFVGFELLFIIGLLVFRKSWKFSINYNKIKLRGTSKTLFVIFFFMYLVLNIIKFKVLGIPLFMEQSRLALFQDSGGLGIISRVLPILNIYCILYSFVKIKSRRRIYVLAIALLLIINALDGSKGYVITFLICFFYIIPLKIKLKRLMIIGFILVFLMFINQLIVLKWNYEGALISSFGRFISNGDVYYNLFPYETYKRFFIHAPFQLLFEQMLAPFHITSYPPNIGYEIGSSINLLDDNTGPNLRPAILCLLMFGKWGGLLAGLIYGLIISFLLRLAYRLRRTSNIAMMSLSLYSIIVICSGITGILDLLGQVMDLIIAYTIVLFILTSIKLYIKLYKKDEIHGILSSAISCNSGK